VSGAASSIQSKHILHKAVQVKQPIHEREKGKTLKASIVWSPILSVRKRSVTATQQTEATAILELKLAKRDRGFVIWKKQSTSFPFFFPLICVNFVVLFKSSLKHMMLNRNKANDNSDIIKTPIGPITKVYSQFGP